MGQGHPPFPRGATGPEIQTIEQIHRAGDRHTEPEVRRALSDALDLIVKLIEARKGRRHDPEATGGFDGCDPPHDEN